MKTVLLVLAALALAGCDHRAGVGTGPYNGSDAAPYTQYTQPGQYSPNVFIGGTVNQVLQTGDGGMVYFRSFNPLVSIASPGTAYAGKSLSVSDAGTTMVWR